jgi:hypothetical protein
VTTSTVWLILLLLPAFGFAARGIDLLLRTEAKPDRLISTTGVIGAISMFVFVVFGPIAVSAFREIFTEFGVDLAAMTQQTIWFNGLLLRLGLILRFAIGLGLSACVLLFPELLFYRPRLGRQAVGKS